MRPPSQRVVRRLELQLQLRQLQLGRWQLQQQRLPVPEQLPHGVAVLL